MKSKLKKFGRRTLRVIAVLLIIGTINKFYQYYAKQKYFKNPIGKISQIGENKLNINVTGNGVATIVLISGGSSWSMDWYYIQQELSKKFKVISYDRAGMGWSTLPTDPDNCNRAMTELDQVIKATNIQPPYVLVGASYGGHLARLYAHDNPQNVQGIVLLPKYPTQ
jgi:pimeloyl-ACP methyl ester carboxylesterase